MTKGQSHYKKAKRIIPGGTQLLSKRPEMFLPELWPAYYQKAKGCLVWDLDGRKYIDMTTMGVGACVLGYADADVDKEVKKAVDLGNMTTLNAPEEVELAELLCSLHPWADMVRYTRSGGEAMSIAVRIARAKTDKDKILFCGYHGWHDWYLSANIADDKSLDGHLLPGLKPKGVPRVLKGTSIPFKYNNTAEFIQKFEENKDSLAAVVMEPLRNYYPDNGFLETVREYTKKRNIVLIFDEVSSGFRLNCGGAHMLFKIYPDIAVFSKSLGNGYPIAAIIGKRDIMNSAQDTFISSTNWTDRIGPTAALATINKFKQFKVWHHLTYIGKKVQNGWIKSAQKYDLKIKVEGICPMSHFDFQYREPLVLKTLYTQKMLGKGFLASNAFYASFAHKDKHVNQYLHLVDETFNFLSKALKDGNAKKYLKGPICQTGFKRLN